MGANNHSAPRASAPTGSTKTSFALENSYISQSTYCLKDSNCRQLNCIDYQTRINNPNCWRTNGREYPLYNDLQAVESVLDIFVHFALLPSRLIMEQCCCQARNMYPIIPSGFLILIGVFAGTVEKEAVKCINF